MSRWSIWSSGRSIVCTIHCPRSPRDALERLGARFLGGVRILRAEGGRVETAEHGTLEADVVIAATGGRPAPPPGLPQSRAPVHGRCAATRSGSRRCPRRRRSRCCTARALRPAPLPALGSGDRDGRARGRGDRRRGRRVRPAAVLVERHRRPAGGRGRRGGGGGGVEGRGGLHVGRDADGAVVAVLVVDEPRRLREARTLVLEGARRWRTRSPAWNRRSVSTFRARRCSSVPPRSWRTRGGASTRSAPRSRRSTEPLQSLLRRGPPWSSRRPRST